MKNERILIIDDNPDDIRILGNILKKEQYLVSIAQSAEIAFKILETELPDCILLDINIPVTNGYEICSKLKSKNNTENIPVIFVTGETNTESIIKGFQSGGHDYVTKPFIIKELIIRIKRTLEIKNYQFHLNELVEMRTSQLTEEIKKQKEYEQKLIEVQKETEMKNIALQEVLKHIESEKKKYHQELLSNIQSVFLPALDKIEKNTGLPNNSSSLVIDQLKEYIKNLTGFSNNILKNIVVQLTPKEYSVCELIKKGKSNKEISDALDISEESVKFHRKNIRKKLNITNSDTNLYYFLNNLNI
ncbi:response regulator [Candidatus Dependentiae bacterium]|nr:response regulator [Candidatus Dependentiae bacterium]